MEILTDEFFFKTEEKILEQVRKPFKLLLLR